MQAVLASDYSKYFIATRERASHRRLSSGHNFFRLLEFYQEGIEFFGT